jgi:hypothetical protein
MHTLPRAFEALLAAAAGAAIAFFAIGALGAEAPLAAAVAVPAGLNGLFGGARRIYAWKTVGGWAAFVLDSSWALISTTLGVLVNVANLLNRASGFGPEFSVRQNRHVFARGFALKRGFANTQGPVISNATCGRDDGLEAHRNLIERHEGLHVWQQRWFGPIHPLVYVVWGLLGMIVGSVYGASSRKRRLAKVRIGKLVETVAYYDNPFEYWAYRNDERWETNSAHSALKWGSFRW